MKKLLFILSVIFVFSSCSSDDDDNNNDTNQLVGKWQVTERKGNIESDVWEEYNEFTEEYTKEGKCILVESDGYTTTTSYVIEDNKILIYYNSNISKTKPNETHVITQKSVNSFEYITYYGEERLDSYRLKRIN